MSSSVECFDRALVRTYRKRKAKDLADHDFLFSWTAENMLERLDLIRRDFKTVLQIGARTPATYDEKFKSRAKADLFVLSDLAPALLRNREPAVVADEEFLPVNRHSFNLVLSPLDLHTVNDLPGALIQIRRALKPDGLFLAAIPGGETLHELRSSFMQAEMEIKGGVSPRVAPFADKQQMGALMQRAGFALPVVDSDTVTVTYENVFALLHDLRGMGESNAVKARSHLPLRRDTLQALAEHYQTRYADSDGRIRATFEIIFMIGWAPHESQQQPLRPGSAKHRLSDALDTEEIGTGEKPR